MAGKYAVDVALPDGASAPPLLPLNTKPVALHVNPFYREQLRTPSAQLDAFNARKARDAARDVGTIVPLLHKSALKLGLLQDSSSCTISCKSINGYRHQ